MWHRTMQFVDLQSEIRLRRKSRKQLDRIMQLLIGLSSSVHLLRASLPQREKILVTNGREVRTILKRNLGGNKI